MSTFSTGLASQPCTLFSPPSDGSRTLVSTVPGFSEHNIGTSIGKQTVPYTLGTLLRVVQRLLIRRYLPDEIKSSISIAEGETYAVSRGEIDNVLVAVKHVKLDRSDHTISQLSLAKRVQAVLQEISIMLHAELANNRNILGIMGYGWTPTTSLPVPFLVVEYGKHGSLRGWLGASSRQTAPGALDEAQPGHSAKELELKVRICQDIASGLSAIHHAGIVHGDLKLDNIIVTEFSGDPSTIQAKISDFGHSIIVEASAPTPIYYGSTIYNAPEVFVQNQHPIPANHLHLCDNWSYGLLLWEVFLDGQVYFEKKWLRDRKYALPRPPCSTNTLTCGQLGEANADESKPSLLNTDQDTVNPQSSSHTANARCSSERSVQQISAREFCGDQNEKRPCGHFEDFDLRHLATLSDSFIGHIDDNAGVLARAGIRRILRATLAFDATIRASDLVSLKPFDAKDFIHYQPDSASQRLANVDLSAEMFRWDQRFEKRYWDIQVELYKDLSSIAELRYDEETSSNIAFQLALCHMEGFGCQATLDEAAIWLSNAQHKNHPLAAFARSQLRPQDTVADYAQNCTNFIKRSVAHTGVIASTGESQFAHRINTKDINHEGMIGTQTVPTLAVAFRQGDFETALKLLRSGASLRDVDEYDCTPFHWLFSVEDHLDALETFLESKGGSTLDALNYRCSRLITIHSQWPLSLCGTPLAFAVITGSARSVRLLLKHGAMPCHPCFTPMARQWAPGTTAIHLAVQNHQFGILELLLRHCKEAASVVCLLDTQAFAHDLARALSNALPIERVLIHGSGVDQALTRTIAVLSQYAAGTFVQYRLTALAQAVAAGYVSLVREVLKQFPITARERCTSQHDPQNLLYPLHWAAEIASNRPDRASENIMELLCSNGALVHDQNTFGQSSLHIAARGNYRKALQWLLEKADKQTPRGEKVERDKNGRTPLHEVKTADALTLLVDHGFSVDAQDTRGQTLVHIACINGLQGVLAGLIEGRASVNTKDWGGNTALHYAVQRGHGGFVAMLCAAGADSSIRNDAGMIALEFAGQRWKEMSGMLLIKPERGELPVIGEVAKFRARDGDDFLSPHKDGVHAHEGAKVEGRGSPTSANLEHGLADSSRDQSNGISPWPYDPEDRLASSGGVLRPANERREVQPPEVFNNTISLEHLLEEAQQSELQRQSEKRRNASTRPSRAFVKAYHEIQRRHNPRLRDPQQSP